jgi:hypothetical protein
MPIEKNVQDENLQKESSGMTMEKFNDDFENLKLSYASLEKSSRNKDYEIAVLRILAGNVQSEAETGTDVQMIIKMSSGLVDDNTTPEQAVQKVIEMVTKISCADAEPKEKNVPVGITLLQPDNPEPGEKEPANLSEALLQNYKK